MDTLASCQSTVWSEMGWDGMSCGWLLHRWKEAAGYGSINIRQGYLIWVGCLGMDGGAVPIEGSLLFFGQVE